MSERRAHRIPTRSRTTQYVAAAAMVALASAGAVVVTQQSAQAANCDTPLTGWASVAGGGLQTTTGGGNAAAQTVTTLADLKKFAADSQPRVIKVAGTISTGTSPVEITSNKTVIGADRNARIVGGINVAAGNSNIIVRNLTIKGVGFGKYPADTAAARGSHHLWFDHLDLSDAGDGLLDLTRGSDFITVSYVKFSYTTNADHRLASLVGGGSTHGDTDKGKMNVTFHHNWFADKVSERMPRVLFGKGHVYNNYYTATGNNYAVGAGSQASVLVENNYFKGIKNAHSFRDNGPAFITARGNVYDGTSGKQATGAANGGVAPFTNPPYSYSADKAADVPAIVTACAGPRLDGVVTPVPPTTTTPTTTPTTSPTKSPTMSPTATATKPTTSPKPTTSATATAPTQPPGGGGGGSASNATGLVGWGAQNGGTTGGGSGATVNVGSASEFVNAVKSDSAQTVRLTADINLSGMTRVGSNKTVVGAGSGKKITGGGLTISGKKNVIIRNLSFDGWDDDAINVQTSTNVWIDHNTFGKGYDGAVDIKRGSDFVTVSWNKVTGHDKAMLLGHSDGNAGQDTGHLRVTYHHNWFDGAKQREPRVRFGNPVHVFNNYYANVGGYGVASTMNAGVLVESNYFENVKDPFHRGEGSSGPGGLVAKNNHLVGSGAGSAGGSVASIPYSYSVDDATAVKSIVTGGAGAGRLNL